RSPRPSTGGFGSSQNQIIPQTDCFPHLGARLPAHQSVHPARQGAFVLVGIAAVEGFRHHQGQYPVTQKLQPLIGAFGIGSRMGERAPEKSLVLKPISEFFGKGFAQDVISPRSGFASNGWQRAISTLPRSAPNRRSRRNGTK